MKYAGVDLHKKTITVCVVVKENESRVVLVRRRFDCRETEKIRAFFEQLGPFQVVVEATASYEWFFQLIEDLADRLVLAHPKRLRIIAESSHKTDRIDAQILAEFLAMDFIPEAYRPSPRTREHRTLTRHRHWLQGRITSIKTKIRAKIANYNADIRHLFTQAGLAHLESLALSGADRFEVKHLLTELELFQKQLKEAEAELREFAKTAPAAEREARAVLKTMPNLGPVTTDVVLSELGDWRRFRSAKRVASFAGLDPGYRESAGKGKQLHITKEGSKLLRWSMIELAWRMTYKLARWKKIFIQLCRKTGSRKKAIVAVARRLLTVIFAMLRDGTAYQFAATNAETAA